MAHEDEVVDGDHRRDARLPQTAGQLARQSVVNLHALALQVAYDGAYTPKGTVKRAYDRYRGEQRPQGLRGGGSICITRIGKAQVGRFDDL